MSKKLKYLILLLLLIVSGILFFVRLGDFYLWEDEAETAVIARNILTRQLPVSWDGLNQVTQEAYHDSNAAKVWTFQTWLPHYFTALSFKIFGVSTWSARLPYALCGWLAVLLLFYLVYRSKKDFAAAFWSAFFLAFSLIFILHARQSRYYALAVILALGWYFLFWEVVKGQKKAWFPAALGGILLFQTQYFIALASWLSTGLSGWFYTADKKKFILDLLKIFSIQILFNLPWIIYVRLWEKSGEMAADLPVKLSSWLVTVFINLINLNHFIFPILLLAAIGYFYSQGKLTAQDKYLFWSGLFYLLIISTNPLYPDIRYLIVLVFWAAYFSAKILLEIKNRYWQILFAMVLVFSNLFSMPFWLPLKPLSPILAGYYQDLRGDMFNYFYELTHDNSGPLEQFVKYRDRQVNKGKTIFVSYEAEPVIFYTDLRVLRELPFKEPPDWIILRGEDQQWPRWLKWVLVADNLVSRADNGHIWNYHQDKEGRQVWSRRRGYLYQYIQKQHYRSITLPVQNTLWENRPTLLWHRWGNEKKAANKLIIYRR